MVYNNCALYPLHVCCMHTNSAVASIAVVLVNSKREVCVPGIPSSYVYDFTIMLHYTYLYKLDAILKPTLQLKGYHSGVLPSHLSRCQAVVRVSRQPSIVDTSYLKHMFNSISSDEYIIVLIPLDEHSRAVQSAWHCHTACPYELPEF